MRPKEKQFGRKVKQKAMNLADPRLMQMAATAGNAAGVVEVPNEPGFIYALSRKGIPYKVLNEVGDIPPRHPIIIGTLASDPNTMRVIKVQDVFWQKLEPRVKPHAKDHGVGGTDPLPIKLEQWMWFKIEPAPDEGPFHVAIYRYSFVTDSDVVLPQSTEYLDLATHVPASGALFVLIEILADGTINVVDGTPVTQRQDLAESDIPLPTSGARRLYAVSLYAGQTRVAIKRDWNDFFDLRLSDLGSGGGGGGGTWGSITGTLSDQTDLQSALDAKEDESNKTDTMAGNEASSTKYLSSKGVYDWVISLGYQAALTAANFGNFLIGLAAKAVPVDADSILVSSAADGDDVKRTTLTEFKAFLKTYFDTLYAAIGGRVVLTANRDYYVRTDGSDSNNGLANTSGGAFLTIQKAINSAAALDMSIYDVTIHIANGTYAEALIFKQCVGSGVVYIVGDTTTPANVVVSGITTITSDGLGTIYNVQGIKGAGAGSFILSRNGSIVDFGNVNIANTGQQLRSDDSGNIRCVANYTISAGATHHIVSVGGFIRIQSFTVTLTGTPAFSGQFCNIGYTGVGILTGITFSGAATGTRYSALLNGVIYTAGAGATYFPGNAGGSTATGGQYA